MNNNLEFEYESELENRLRGFSSISRIIVYAYVAGALRVHVPLEVYERIVNDAFNYITPRTISHDQNEVNTQK